MKEYTVEDLLSYEVSNTLDDGCPDFISKALAKNGSELSQEELEWLNDNDHQGIGKVVEASVEDWLMSVCRKRAISPQPQFWMGM